LTVIHALLLGIIQGLTEFLPVSSSGHLVLAQNLLKIDKVLLEKAVFFDLTLHMGTVVAVLYCYRNDIRDIFIGIFKKDKSQVDGENKLDSRIIWLFIISIIGTAIIAFPMRKIITEAFENAVYAAIGLVVTSFILLSSILAKGKFDLSRMNGMKAFLVGLAQGIATMPGVSRSGCTIVCGMLLGFSPKEAARYSFLLSVPTIILASLVEGIDAIKEGSLNVPPIDYVVGFTAAMVFGIIAINTLIRFLERTHIAWFAVYCFPIGIITYFLVK
jgi:undecaprenyl-diphosphatase